MSYASCQCDAMGLILSAHYAECFAVGGDKRPIFDGEIRLFFPVLSRRQAWNE